MAEHPHREHPSLDSQAFAIVLSAMFICTLLWIIGPVAGERAAEPVALVAASQLKCPHL